MSFIKSVKTSETETILLLLVPDAFLPHISGYMDDLKAKWFAGEEPFSEAMQEVVTFTTAAAQPAPEMPEGSNIISMLQRAASVGARMTDSQERRMRELFGDARASALFGPNWGEGAFRLAKVADPQTLTRHDGKWVQINNTSFRQDVYNAIMAWPLPADPMAIPMGNEYRPGPDTSNDHLLTQGLLPPQMVVPQDVNFYGNMQIPPAQQAMAQHFADQAIAQTANTSQPQFVPPQYQVAQPQMQAAYQQVTHPGLHPQFYPQKLEELIKLSHTGRDLSNAQLGLIDKTIKFASARIFNGRKDGSMQEFLRLCSKSRRKADKTGYEPNPEFDQQFFDYVNRFCGN